MTANLAFLRVLADSIALLFAPHAEVVLHDLSTGKIAHIANCFSKRRNGDSSLLDVMDADLSQMIIGPYTKTNWDGRRLKSISVVIRNETGNPVGLICINHDIEAFSLVLEQLSALTTTPAPLRHATDLFQSDWRERLNEEIDVYERGVSLNVMSNAYGLPGLRIGWLAAKGPEFFVRYKHFLSICNSGPSELLAEIALKARERILERNRLIVRSNITKLGAFFADFPELFEWREPDGGRVAFIQYKGKDGVEAFTARLVEEAGVLLLPSSVYHSDLGPVPKNRFRIGFGRDNMDDGLSAFRNWLRRNHP